MKENDKISDVTEKLQEDIDELAREHVEVMVDRDMHGTTVGEIEAEIDSNVEIPTEMAARFGVFAGLAWMRKQIEQQFEKNLDDYERRKARGVEELAEKRKEDIYENVRLMARIDTERRDEMIETLRERGL